jgi:hypothetical protein
MTMEFISRVPTDYSTTVHIKYQKALPATIQYTFVQQPEEGPGAFPAR